MKTRINLYSPTNGRAKPIQIKLSKDELQQMVVGLYRHVDTHPVGKFMKVKGGR